MVLPLFSINIVSLVLTGCGFVLPCMHFLHLALSDNLTPDYTWAAGRVLHGVEESLPVSDVIFLSKSCFGTFPRLISTTESHLHLNY